MIQAASHARHTWVQQRFLTRPLNVAQLLSQDAIASDLTGFGPNSLLNCSFRIHLSLRNKIACFDLDEFAFFLFRDGRAANSYGRYLHARCSWSFGSVPVNMNIALVSFRSYEIQQLYLHHIAFHSVVVIQPFTKAIASLKYFSAHHLP